MLKSLFNFSTLVFAAQPIAALALCTNWNPATKLGTLDESILREASGLAISQTFPDRLYHVNDKGDDALFYQTDSRGQGTKKIAIANYSPVDTEDLAYGKCSESGTGNCLIVADIGDNEANRDSVELVIIKDTETFGATAFPFKIVTLTYPDRPHNAEAISMHPNGDIFIVTKEKVKKKAHPAQVFRLAASNWRSNTNSFKLEHVGKIEVPSLAPGATFRGQIVTSFDISPDGKNILLLTYENAIEIELDLSAERSFVVDATANFAPYRVIPLATLPKQESIAYELDGGGFLFDTEQDETVVPLMQMRCATGR